MEFLMDPHCHAAEVSRCSKLPGKQLIEEVKNAGCQGLIVTDHYDPEFFEGYETGARFKQRLKDDFLQGYYAALEEGQKQNILVLPGLELRTKAGPEDFLIYGVEVDELCEMGCLTGLPIQKVRQLVNECGGLFMQAHPFRRYLTCMAAQALDGVEVVNGNPRHDSQNALALRFAEENPGLLRCAGSDVHQIGDAGGAGMVLDHVPSVKSFAKAIKEGSATLVWQDAALDKTK